ncbi:hypothetical protein QBC39DRAFT_344178 [Podospora conica]|nr:hypothetical protein QBC39DRAFT_344178 [Schizothecium conicum]
MYRPSRTILPGITKPLSSTAGLTFSRPHPFTAHPPTTSTSQISQSPYSTDPKTQPSAQQTTNRPNPDLKPSTPPVQQKTQSQLDQELREKMEGLSGDGGASGVEYEDGQPVAMKRSVKDNMFRYI